MGSVEIGHLQLPFTVHSLPFRCRFETGKSSIELVCFDRFDPDIFSLRGWRVSDGPESLHDEITRSPKKDQKRVFYNKNTSSLDFCKQVILRNGFA